MRRHENTQQRNKKAHEEHVLMLEGVKPEEGTLRSLQVVLLLLALVSAIFTSAIIISCNNYFSKHETRQKNKASHSFRRISRSSGWSKAL